MSDPRHNAEGYRAICIILLVVIGFLAWQWHQSEQHRLNLLDELNDAKYTIEELEKKNEDLSELVSWYEDKY